MQAEAFPTPTTLNEAFYQIKALQAENEKLRLEVANKNGSLELMKAKLEKYDHKSLKNSIKIKDEEIFKLRDELSKLKLEFVDYKLKAKTSSV